MQGGGNLAGLKHLTSSVNIFKQVLVYPFFCFLCLTFRGTKKLLSRNAQPKVMLLNSTIHNLA